MDGDSIARLLYLGLLVVAVGGWFIGSNRPSLGKSLQMALVWGMIFVGVIAVYGLWNDISDNFTPHGVTHTETEVIVPRSDDGHYHLSAWINDVRVDFLVDTGATNVVLTQKDAARIGINVAGLDFIYTANTANGQVSIAYTDVDRFELGEFVDYDVQVSVNGGEMDGSLLGMSYLNRYSHIEIQGDQLILRR